MSTCTKADLKKLKKAQRLCMKGQRYMQKAADLSKVVKAPMCPPDCMYNGGICVCNNYWNTAQKTSDPICPGNCEFDGADCVCSNN